MEPACFALCFPRKALVLFPIKFSPERERERDSSDQNGSQDWEWVARGLWPTSIDNLLHPSPYCNVLAAGLSLTGPRSPVVIPEEAIALCVISQKPRTRLPKTLGRDGDNDSDCAVSTIYQAWFSGPCGHMSLSKMPSSSRLRLLPIFCMRELRLRER
jgi:hypothetical protein